MFKFSISAAVLLISTQAFAFELVCEGWQQKPGQALQRVPMIKGEQNAQNWKQSVEIDGYKYDVNWDINLDTIYATITSSGIPVLFTTARVPTYSHNDSFTDLKLPNGLRLSVSCNFK